MKIEDERGQHNKKYQFHQLQKGWWVQGVETGNSYFVVEDRYGAQSSTNLSLRLVNTTGMVMDPSEFHTGDFLRLHDVTLVIR